MALSRFGRLSFFYKGPWVSAVLAGPILVAGVTLGLELSHIIFWAGSTYLLMLSLWIEKDWLEFTPLTPLTATMFAAYMRCGIAIPVLAYIKAGNLASEEFLANPKVSAMVNHINEVQILWLIFMGSLVASFLLLRRQADSKKISLFSEYLKSSKSSNSLVVFVLACGIFSLTWIVIGIISCTLDRNPEMYFEWVYKIWRPDSLFVIFGRLRDIFFFLVPAALKASKKFSLKISIATIAISYLSLASIVGGRGIILSPLLWLVF